MEEWVTFKDFIATYNLKRATVYKYIRECKLNVKIEQTGKKKVMFLNRQTVSFILKLVKANQKFFKTPKEIKEIYTKKDREERRKRWIIKFSPGIPKQLINSWFDNDINEIDYIPDCFKEL